MQLSGTVTSGLGRAHVFMAQSHYQEQFKTILGSGAWPGTLNVDISDENISTYRELRILAGLEEGETSANIESIRIAWVFIMLLYFGWEKMTKKGEFSPKS